MGQLKSIKDGLKTAVSAAVTGCSVIVGVDPEKVDIERYSTFVVIIPDLIEYEDNVRVMGETGSVTQWGSFTWSLYLYAGHAGTGEDAIDRLDALITQVDSIAGTRPTTACGNLERAVGYEMIGWLGGSPLIRQTWKHGRNPTA